MRGGACARGEGLLCHRMQRGVKFGHDFGNLMDFDSCRAQRTKSVVRLSSFCSSDFQSHGIASALYKKYCYHS